MRLAFQGSGHRFHAKAWAARARQVLRTVPFQPDNQPSLGQAAAGRDKRQRFAAFHGRLLFQARYSPALLSKKARRSSCGNVYLFVRDRLSCVHQLQLHV